MNDATERPAGSSTTGSRTLSLDSRLLFAAALLICVAPLWSGPYLPLVDLPQHAGQVVAMREILRGNPLFGQMFEINWFTPYLLGYLLLYGLALLVPITVATKILVSLAVVSIPLLSAQLLRVADANERLKWLTIPGAYSYALYAGFLSYLIAVPFALLFLIHAFRFVRQPSTRGAVLIATFSVLLFFCHVVALGFAAAVALGYLCAVHYHAPRTLLLRALPFAAPLPLIVFWVISTRASETAVQGAPVVFGPMLVRLLLLFAEPAGIEYFSVLAALAVVAAIGIGPRLVGARFGTKPERWAPFAVGLLLFLITPQSAFNTGFLYERLGVFLVPLWLLAWEPAPVSGRRFEWVVMPLVMVWVLMNAGRFADFTRETRSFDVVVANMQPGRRVASMVYDAWNPSFGMPVYLHFPSWYQATRAGIVDFNFAYFHPQWVRYRDRAASRVGEQLAWNPLLFDWEAHGGANYDYFIVKSQADISAGIFKDKLGAVRLIAHSGPWWLYENPARGPAADPGR
jgi:hypothetical protein